jgi:hypothetical protein
VRNLTLESAIAAAARMGLRNPPPMSVGSAAYSQDAIHPFRQQRNGVLVQFICNSTEQLKVRRRLEE